jgi:hypothetical protein
MPNISGSKATSPNPPLDLRLSLDAKNKAIDK